MDVNHPAAPRDPGAAQLPQASATSAAQLPPTNDPAAPRDALPELAAMLSVALDPNPDVGVAEVMQLHGGLWLDGRCEHFRLRTAVAMMSIVSSRLGPIHARVCARRLKDMAAAALDRASPSSMLQTAQALWTVDGAHVAWEQVVETTTRDAHDDNRKPRAGSAAPDRTAAALLAFFRATIDDVAKLSFKAPLLADAPGEVDSIARYVKEWCVAEKDDFFQRVCAVPRPHAIDFELFAKMGPQQQEVMLAASMYDTHIAAAHPRAKSWLAEGKVKDKRAKLTLQLLLELRVPPKLAALLLLADADTKWALTGPKHADDSGSRLHFKGLFKWAATSPDSYYDHKLNTRKTFNPTERTILAIEEAAELLHGSYFSPPELNGIGVERFMASNTYGAVRVNASVDGGTKNATFSVITAPPNPCCGTAVFLCSHAVFTRVCDATTDALLESDLVSTANVARCLDTASTAASQGVVTAPRVVFHEAKGATYTSHSAVGTSSPCRLRKRSPRLQIPDPCTRRRSSCSRRRSRRLRT